MAPGAQPVILAPDNPDSPYNDMAGAGNPPEVMRPETINQAYPGVYEGEEKDGVRHGIGTCTWEDGSFYTGDWVLNRRHGNGLWKATDGTSYEGQWVNDVKHGRGKLTYADGEVITGTWQNDRVNGLAYRTRHGKTENVIYKNDILIIANVTGVSCCDGFYFVMAFLACVTFWGAIPLGIYFEPLLFLLFLVYIPYVIWSCCHYASRYIKNMKTLDVTK